MWLRRFRAFWSQHLDALATELARGKRERRMNDASDSTMGTEPDTKGDTHDRRRTPMIDIDGQIKATHREVGERGTADGALVGVVLRRRYDAPAGDVWDAITDPDRVKRWFLPLSGDLKEGGSFQLEGNAGGEILRCDPPRLLKVTFGGPTSIVEVRLIPEGDGETVFELAHNVPLEMAGSVAGALYVGPGWDGAFLALGLYLQGEVAEDPVAAGRSPEGQAYSRASVDAWLTVVEASGEATADQIAAATSVALGQFAPAEGEDHSASGS